MTSHHPYSSPSTAKICSADNVILYLAPEQRYQPPTPRPSTLHLRPLNPTMAIGPRVVTGKAGKKHVCQSGINSYAVIVGARNASTYEEGYRVRIRQEERRERRVIACSHTR